MFSEEFADSSAFDTLLGRVTDNAQPMEDGNENAANKFLVPDNKSLEYDFRSIDGIYKRYPPALQLPVVVTCNIIEKLWY